MYFDLLHLLAVNLPTSITEMNIAIDQMPAEEAMMIEETEDLRQAAEQSQRENVLLELTLDSIIKWVSSSWQDVIGYTILPQS